MDRRSNEIKSDINEYIKGVKLGAYEFNECALYSLFDLYCKFCPFCMREEYEPVQYETQEYAENELKYAPHVFKMNMCVAYRHAGGLK